MNKIPFDIKYRDKIESGEYQVITRANKPVDILDWDYKDTKTIVCCNADGPWMVWQNGKYFEGENCESDNDLFLMVDEEMVVKNKIRDLLLSAHDTWKDGGVLFLDRYVAEIRAIFAKENHDKWMDYKGEIIKVAQSAFMDGSHAGYKHGFNDGVTETEKKVKEKASESMYLPSVTDIASLDVVIAGLEDLNHSQRKRDAFFGKYTNGLGVTQNIKDLRNTLQKVREDYFKFMQE